MMSGVVTTVNVLMNLLIGVIIALYILNSKDTFCAQAKKMTYSLFTVEKANAIMARVAHIHRVFGGFITGKLMDSSIIGMLCFIGMRLMISFGWMTMPTSYALLIAVIIGVTNIIPFFGPFLGAIPSAFLILLVSPLKCLYFIIFIIIWIWQDLITQLTKWRALIKIAIQEAMPAICFCSGMIFL